MQRPAPHPPKRRRRGATLVAALVAAATLAAAPPARASDQTQVGLWIASGFIDLLYTPTKTCFFFLMGVGGGLSAIVTVPMSRMDISAQIIKWGFYGDWLVRPDHFSYGEWPQFVGFEDEIRFVDEAPPGPRAPQPPLRLASESQGGRGRR
jgi:hypothetical protein